MAVSPQFFWTLLLHGLIFCLIQTLIRIQGNVEVDDDAACFTAECGGVEQLVYDLRIWLLSLKKLDGLNMLCTISSGGCLCSLPFFPHNGTSLCSQVMYSLPCFLFPHSSLTPPYLWRSSYEIIHTSFLFAVTYRNLIPEYFNLHFSFLSTLLPVIPLSDFSIHRDDNSDFQLLDLFFITLFFYLTSDIYFQDHIN